MTQGALLWWTYSSFVVDRHIIRLGRMWDILNPKWSWQNLLEQESMAICVASVLDTQPGKPAMFISWIWVFASSEFCGVTTCFSKRVVLPYWMNLWKMIRWVSSLIHVCSSQSSKHHPLPKYLKVASNSRGNEEASLPTQFLFPSFHFEKKGVFLGPSTALWSYRKEAWIFDGTLSTDVVSFDHRF